MSVGGHWDGLFANKDEESFGWFESAPATLDAVLKVLAGRSSASSILDVGAGTSRLVDYLLSAGYSDVTLLDLSRAALDRVQRRLAEQTESSEQVNYLVDDVRSFQPVRQWDLWHDRAAFHFLVDAADRQLYRRTLGAAVSEGGSAVIATFSLDGPDSCAGLPVARYDEASLSAEFAPGLDCIECWTRRPGGDDSDARPYVICSFEKH